MESNDYLDKIDLEKLRTDLKLYFHFGVILQNPFGVADQLNVDNICDNRLVKVALENGFDLKNYLKGKQRKR